MSKTLLPARNSAEVHPFDVDWRERVVVLGSVMVLLLFLFAAGKRYAPAQTVEVLGLVPVTFFAVGKFLPLWGISGRSSMGPYELGMVIWGLDVLTVLAFVYSFEVFYKIAPIRRALDRLNTNMKLVLKVYPGIRRASVVGVVLLVLFPVSGTGALAASLVGILLGMNRFVLIASVVAGGCIGSMLMAFLATNFAGVVSSLEAVQRNPSNRYWIGAAFLSLLVVGVIYLNRSFRRALERAEAESEP